MHCSTCPDDRREHCRLEGCNAHHAPAWSIAGAGDGISWSLTVKGEPPAAVLAQLTRGQVERAVTSALAIEVKRLDVENNDILIVRTAEKLSPEKAADFHDRVLELAQRHGVKGVTVVVLDGCTDLTIERPSTAMAHQRPRPQPQPMG